MIVAVFSPIGIVTATQSVDVFYENIEGNDCVIQKSDRIDGLPHSFIFWNKYSLIYRVLDNHSYNDRLEVEFERLSRNCQSVPSVNVFMSYLQKLVQDEHLQFFGVVSAYDYNENNELEPYVFQIVGENIRRVNLDSEGNVDYNFVYLEKKPIIGKLFQCTKILNGEEWEDAERPNIHCKWYSISKSLDLCKFMLKAYQYIDNINEFMFESPIKSEVSIVTRDKIEIQKIII